MAKVISLQSTKVDMATEVHCAYAFQTVIIKASSDNTEQEINCEIRLTKQEALTLASQLITEANKLRD